MQQFQGLYAIDLHAILDFQCTFQLFSLHWACYAQVRFLCHRDVVNEELAMQASMVSYAFLCLSTCLLLRDVFYAIA